jgi:predicted O-methyltransferase YrrM
MPSLTRAAKEQAKKAIHSLFLAGQHLGVDILPRHFYSQIPDMRELRSSKSWRAPRSMYGVNGTDLDGQLEFVRDCVDESMRKLLIEEKIYESACADNGAIGYGPVEAAFLFCFAAHHRPRRIIQVGAGVSTSVLLHAARVSGYRPQITCIDPYPTEYLKRTAASGQIDLIEKKCQDVDVSMPADLGSGDLLFIDSTHTVKPGSEVNYLILEILPRLRPGCTVHFHDIYFPYDYSTTQLDDLFVWNETALLLAFLTGNHNYTILASLNMLHNARPAELQNLMPDYRPIAMEQGLRVQGQTGHYPSSIFLKVTA